MNNQAVKTTNPPRLPETEQRRASDPESSVWVGASAGSGKTKVLADRVVRLLLAEVPPQRILGLTFTRAAAAEMSIRITQQLGKWATCDDDALRDDLDALQGVPPMPTQLDAARRLFARVLSCPGGLRIRTLHAFGQEVLRRFPLEAGLSPHFAVLDEADARALWHEAQNDVLRSASFAPESPEGAALKTLVSDLGEDGFAAILREATNDQQRLDNAIDNAGGLAPLIARIRDMLELSPDDDEAKLLSRAVDDGAFARGDLVKAATWLLEGTKTDCEKGKDISDWLAAPPVVRAERFADYRGAFLTDSGEQRKTLATKKIAAAYPEIIDIMERESARLMSVTERLDTLRIAERTAALTTLAVAIGARYAARKTAESALDYDDLIKRTDELLRRDGIAPWVLFKLDGGVDHILVDEAQDTSPEQWRIVAALADEFFTGKSARETDNRTLFAVGDEKQSIFSFRGADPDTFDDMRKHFAARITGAKRAFSHVPLNISFRSAPAILKAVDAVFADERACRGVAHGEVKHYPHRRGAAGRVEVWPLLESPEKAKETPTGIWTLPVGYESERDPAAELAEKIALQIKKWKRDGETVYDRKLKHDRPMTEGDVMILVRRRDRFVEHLVRQLKKLEVPVTGVDRMRLVEQLAVMDLLALLQFALLPDDDLNLATVLKSPLIGCSEEQLMELAIGRNGSLWRSLNDRADGEEAPPLGGRASSVPCQSIRSYLLYWLNSADKITPLAMLSRILGYPCPADSISGKRAIWARLGPDAQDPIDELLNAAQNFGTRHTPSLQAFLHWLMATEAEIKRELDQGMGRVRITTVHASKGLEAPIVILPDTTTVPLKQKLPKFLWHPEHAVPFYIPREPMNAALRALRDRAHDKQMEEYRRLLYVALTRAADRLYVCGWRAERTARFEDSWYSLIKNALEPLHEPTASDDTGVIAFADYNDPYSPACLGMAGEKPSPPVSSTGQALGGRVGLGVGKQEQNPMVSTKLYHPPPNPPPKGGGLSSRYPDDAPSTRWCGGSPSPHVACNEGRGVGVRGGDSQTPPVWLNAPPPPEPTPPRPLIPSRATDDDSDPPLASPLSAAAGAYGFARGRIIHRLLQNLPDIAEDKRDEAAARFLANPQHRLAPERQTEIRREVMALLRHPDYARLFAHPSRAEVPLVGRIGDRLVAGQVDRLCVRETEVWIVDYKTNRPPPQSSSGVADIYLRQLSAYRAVLREIYPDKTVRCFLLWTYEPRLMPIPDDLL